MLGLAWFFIFFRTFALLAYKRASLIISTLCFSLLMIFLTYFNGITLAVIITWIAFLLIAYST